VGPAAVVVDQAHRQVQLALASPLGQTRQRLPVQTLDALKR
jgi:hypothetical protein